MSFFVVLVLSLLQLPNAFSADGKNNKPSVKPATVIDSVMSVEGTLALRHTIKIKVNNIDSLLTHADSDLSRVILYIDGIAFPSKKNKPGLLHDALSFDLRRDEENKAAWTTLLGRKGDPNNPNDNFCRRSVEVTVGFENERPIPTAATAVPLVRVDESWLTPFLGAGLAFLVLFIVLAVKSDILRDTGTIEDTSQRKMYSLARTQMALWTFVVIIAYVFIWMVTSDISSLTPGVIGLMGISALTGLGSAAIDSSRQSGKINQRTVEYYTKKSCAVEVEKLNTEISSLTEAINATPSPSNLDEQKTIRAAKQAELAAKKKEIENAEKEITRLNKKLALEPASGNFFNDILNDDKGVSLHRFQILIWTIVLIFIFTGRVIDTLTMPEFNATLLALMGISGATYIGFKLPEQQG